MDERIKAGALDALLVRLRERGDAWALAEVELLIEAEADKHRRVAAAAATSVIR